MRPSPETFAPSGREGWARPRHERRRYPVQADSICGHAEDFAYDERLALLDLEGLAVGGEAEPVRGCPRHHLPGAGALHPTSASLPRDLRPLLFAEQVHHAVGDAVARIIEGYKAHPEAF